MNKFQTKQASIGIALLLILVSCNKDEFVQLINFTFTNKLVVNVANIQLIDAGRSNEKIETPADIEVTVVGTPSAPLFDMEGYSQLKYVNEIITIAVSPENAPSPTKPLIFSLMIKHKSVKYAPVVIQFTISSNNVEDRIVKLLDKTKLPTGVEANSQTIQIDPNSCQTTTATIFTTFKGNKTTITIPAGTTFLDKTGNKVCATIEGTLLSFNPTGDDVSKFFPGGLAYKASMASSGVDLGNGIFTPYGFFSLILNTGDVYTFSKDALVTMDVMREVKRSILINSPIDSILKDNDKVPVWSSENGLKWTTDRLSTVSASKMTFTIGKTGYWNVADPSCINVYNYCKYKFQITFERCPPCTPELTFKTLKGIDSRYYTEVSLASNNRLIISSPMIRYKDALNFSLTPYLGEIDTSVKLNFRVYDSEPWNEGKAIFTKLNFSPCTDGQLRMDTVKFPQYASIETDFQIVCPNSNGVRTTFTPSASIYSKELINGVETARWNNIGLIQNGQGISVNKLKCGSTYKFAIISSRFFTTDEMDKVEQNYQLSPNKGIRIPIFCDSSFNVRFVKNAWELDKKVDFEYIDKKYYKMIIGAWSPSTKLCKEYLDRFK
jgi:hypothetical protein